jgi:thiamine-monophosphate kinase
MNELEIVEWMRRRSRIHSTVVTGIGDDMAVLAPRGSGILLSSDLLLEGVHFRARQHAWSSVGRKAVARVLSDCAAMAVRPVAILFSVALSRSLASSDVRELLEGMSAMAEQFDAAVVGGDTARWDGPLAIDVSVMAEPFPGIAPLRRSGVRPGDRFMVTGTLGGSIRRKHIEFVPRIFEARQIAERLGGRLHALMDLSDGLGLDLQRMCEASGAGAVLDEELLDRVVSEDAKWCAAADGKPLVEHALADGEDYELLAAVAADAEIAGLGLAPIGVATDEGLAIRRRDGGIEPLVARGWVH